MVVDHDVYGELTERPAFLHYTKVLKKTARPGSLFVPGVPFHNLSEATMALNLVDQTFRGEWQCRHALAHGHVCVHCDRLVLCGQRAIATTIIRNGEWITNYLAHERCHDVVDRRFFGRIAKEMG